MQNQSNMKTKHRAYTLTDIKKACSDHGKLDITIYAQTSAMALGMNNNGIVDTIQNMRSQDYDHTITADANPEQQMDVYMPTTHHGKMYIKFSSNRRRIYIVSFKKN